MAISTDFQRYNWKRYSSGGDKIAADNGLAQIFEGWEGDVFDLTPKLGAAIRTMFAGDPDGFSGLGATYIDELLVSQKASIPVVYDGSPSNIRDAIDSIRALLGVAAYDWPSWYPTWQDPETGTRRLSLSLLKETRKAIGLWWGSANVSGSGLVKNVYRQRRVDYYVSGEAYEDVSDPSFDADWSVSNNFGGSPLDDNTYAQNINVIWNFDFTAESNFLELGGPWIPVIVIGFSAAFQYPVITSITVDTAQASDIGYRSDWPDYTLYVGVYEDDPSTQTVQERYETVPSTILFSKVLSKDAANVITLSAVELSDYIVDGIVRIKVWATDELPPMVTADEDDEEHLTARILGYASGGSYIGTVVGLMAKDGTSTWSYD